MLICARLHLFENTFIRGKSKKKCFFPIFFDFRGRLYFHSQIGPSYLSISRYMFDGEEHTGSEIAEVISQSKKVGSYALYDEHKHGVYVKVKEMLRKHQSSLYNIDNTANYEKFQNFYANTNIKEEDLILHEVTPDDVFKFKQALLMQDILMLATANKADIFARHMKESCLNAAHCDNEVTKYTDFSSVSTELLIKEGLETLERHLVTKPNVKTMNKVEDAVNLLSRLKIIVKPTSLRNGGFTPCDFASNGHMVRAILYGISNLEFLNLDSGKRLHCPYVFLIASFREIVYSYILDIPIKGEKTTTRDKLKKLGKEYVTKWHKLKELYASSKLSKEETLEILNTVFNELLIRRAVKGGIMTVDYNCSYPKFASETYKAIFKAVFNAKQYFETKDGKETWESKYYYKLIPLLFNVLRNLDDYGIIKGKKHITLNGAKEMLKKVKALGEENITLESFINDLNYKLQLPDGFTAGLAKYDSVTDANRCVVTLEGGKKRTQRHPSPRQLPYPNSKSSKRSMDPNVIHALDGYLLRRIIMSQTPIGKRGKNGLITVHDYFNFPRIELFLYKSKCEIVFSEDLFDPNFKVVSREGAKDSMYIIH
jgi:hypothetical protein